MDFFHFFSKNYFFLLKTQKEIWEIFFTFLEYSVRWLFSRINIIFGLVKIAVKSNGSKKKMSFSQNCSNGSVFGLKHIFSFWRNIFSKRCDVSKFQKKFCFLDFSPNFQYFWKVEEPPKRFLRDVLAPCFCKMKLFYPKFQKEKKLFPPPHFFSENKSVLKKVLNRTGLVNKIIFSMSKKMNSWLRQLFLKRPLISLIYEKKPEIIHKKYQSCIIFSNFLTLFFWKFFSS